MLLSNKQLELPLSSATRGSFNWLKSASQSSDGVFGNYRLTSGLPTTHPKLTCSVERPVPFLYAVELWSLRLLHERQHHFCRFTYWAVKSRRSRTQFVFRFRFLFSASSPSSWEPCWQRHSRLAWPIGPCGCPPSCWWSSLCWIVQRFQASEVV